MTQFFVKYHVHLFCLSLFCMIFVLFLWVWTLHRLRKMNDRLDRTQTFFRVLLNNDVALESRTELVEQTLGITSTTSATFRNEEEVISILKEEGQIKKKEVV